jgi:hypothetical protein
MVEGPDNEDASPKRKRRRKPDPYYAAAVQNTKEAARRLLEAGIVDAEGRRIRKDLPPGTCVKGAAATLAAEPPSIAFAFCYPPKISSKPYAQAACIRSGAKSRS